MTRIKPTASTGSPIAVRMMVIATRLAAGIPATPMEVNQGHKDHRELLDEAEFEAVSLGQKHGSHAFIESRSVHVHRRSQRQHEAARPVGYPRVFFQRTPSSAAALPRTMPSKMQ